MRYKILMWLSKLICCFPHSFLLFLGKIFGNLYYLLIKKQRKLAIKQMKQALHFSDEKTKELVRQSFINLATNIFEILYMPNLNEKNMREYIEIDHLERMEQALAKKKGVVVLTGHIGTWEWLSAAFTLSGMPVTAIAKKQPNEQYTRALDDLRAMIHVEIFSRGTSELLAAGRALRKGKILGFLADQDGGFGGALVDFLGRPASTPLGPAVFATKFQAPVLPCFILRRPDGRHKVMIFEEMYCNDTGDPEKDLYEFTERMTKIIEQVIRENPTQWLWFQKRWNTLPEEMKKFHVPHKKK